MNLTGEQNGPIPGYPNQNQGYPRQDQGYPQPDLASNPGYPPTHPGGNSAPAAGFVPAMVPPYGQVPPGSGTPFTPPPQQTEIYGKSDAEDPMQDEIKGFDFSEKSIRRGFIRKVYSILMLQLLITLGFISWFLYHEKTKLWVQNHWFVLIIAFVLTIVILIAMTYCTSLRRKAPTNYIFLFVFTCVEGFMLGSISSNFEREEVLLAVGITAAVCLGLTIFAFQTKWDFTMLNGILFVALIVFLIFSIVAIFMHNKIVTLVISSVGALLFSIYLVYDTQIMMGGGHEYAISPEEYIFAALDLYLDIINILIYILRIIGFSGN